MTDLVRFHFSYTTCDESVHHDADGQREAYHGGEDGLATHHIVDTVSVAVVDGAHRRTGISAGPTVRALTDAIRTRLAWLMKTTGADQRLPEAALDELDVLAPLAFRGQDQTCNAILLDERTPLREALPPCCFVDEDVWEGEATSRDRIPDELNFVDGGIEVCGTLYRGITGDDRGVDAVIRGGRYLACECRLSVPVIVRRRPDAPPRLTNYDERYGPASYTHPSPHQTPE